MAPAIVPKVNKVSHAFAVELGWNQRQIEKPAAEAPKLYVGKVKAPIELELVYALPPHTPIGLDVLYVGGTLDATSAKLLEEESAKNCCLLNM